MAHQEHLHALAQGRYVWILWRERNSEVDPDLIEADLREADLRGLDLQNANLTGANLGGADLRLADLRNANLQNADLTGADLGCADVRKANINGAIFNDAKLYGTIFDHGKHHVPMGLYLGLVPKAELHVHLEGTIQPATLLALAHRNHVPLPVQTIEEMQQFFAFRDFRHFIEVYLAISSCLKTVVDYEQVVYEFGMTMADQHVRYAEVTFSPCTHFYRRDVPFETYFTGLTRGRERAKRDFGVEINWIFDIVRDVASGPGISPRADYTVAVAMEGRGDGVIALGLGGSEVGYPPEWFEKWFDKARGAGLHSVPHAGENAGPASIWGALQALGAERIGHGVRAIEDPRLVAYLAEKQIPLEVSPTSNLRLGIYPNIAEHPFLLLHGAGVPLTINSDDPALFNTTLTQEVELLVQSFHFERSAVNEVLLNGVRHSFLPAHRKRALETIFQDEMRELQKSS